MGIIEGQPVAAGSSHFTTAINLLARRAGRAQRAAHALIVGAAVYEIGHKLAKRADTELSYTVAVPHTDDVYADIHAWLLDSIPSKRRKALTARSGRSSSNEVELCSPGGVPRRSMRAALKLFYDGTTSQSVVLDGHRVKVHVDKDKAERIMSLDSMRDWRDPERIMFTCRGEAARDAVLAFIRKVADARMEDVTTRFFIADKWGNWNRRNDLAPRPLDTVILAPGQQERIVADLAEFLSAEQRYTRIGAPWHRGYLFHGPPGTGKTSFARALAEHFELDVHYIPVPDLENDTNLLSLLGGIEPRSMLVLEDLDIVHGSKSRDDAESKGISLSGLLNALDGFATPHGLVTVMTTNDMSVLDPALIRPGRADRIEELGYLDDWQLARLIELVCGAEPDKFPGLVDDQHLTHAQVVEVAKAHLDNPDEALRAITDLVLDGYPRAGVLLARGFVDPEALKREWDERIVLDEVDPSSVHWNTP